MCYAQSLLVRTADRSCMMRAVRLQRLLPSTLTLPRQQPSRFCRIPTANRPHSSNARAVASSSTSHHLHHGCGVTPLILAINSNNGNNHHRHAAAAGCVGGVSCSVESALLFLTRTPRWVAAAAVAGLAAAVAIHQVIFAIFAT